MATGYGPKWTITENQTATPGTPNPPQILIQAQSSGLDDGTTRPRNQLVQINGTSVVNSSSPRSYRMTRLTNTGSGWTYNASNGYDVYGNQTAADNALAFLQTFQDSDILVLNTWDEPNNRRTTFRDELVNNFGAKLQYSSTWGSRCSYLLVAVKGKGALHENIKPRYTTELNVVSMWLGF